MKYLIILFVSAALLITAIVGTGNPLDAGTLLAVGFASCLPAWMAYEYRAELWPKRAAPAVQKTRDTAAAPAAATTAHHGLRNRLPGILAWHRPSPPVFAPGVTEH